MFLEFAEAWRAGLLIANSYWDPDLLAHDQVRAIAIENGFNLYYNGQFNRLKFVEAAFFASSIFLELSVPIETPLEELDLRFGGINKVLDMIKFRNNMHWRAWMMTYILNPLVISL